MLRLHGIIGRAGDADCAARLHHVEHHGGLELLFVPPADAGRKRFRLTTDRGTDCAVSLDRDEELVDGAVLFLEHDRAIVARFGRFPHRNAVLGRPSTPEEIEFLKTPGSGF